MKKMYAVINDDDILEYVTNNIKEAQDSISYDSDRYMSVCSLTDVEYVFVYDSDDELFNPDLLVTITGIIDGDKVEAYFNVQLDFGEYKPQNGAWITTGGGDMEFDLVEDILWHSADLDWSDEWKKYKENSFKIHDIDDYLDNDIIKYKSDLVIIEYYRDYFFIAEYKDVRSTDYGSTIGHYSVIYDSIDDCLEDLKEIEDIDDLHYFINTMY